MLVRIGAGQPRGDLGAIHRRRHHAEAMVKRRDIETREVEDLQARRIGDQALEVGSVGRIGGNLHDVGAAVARRKLYDAQPIAMRIEPHGFGVDRDCPAVAVKVRQVTTMQSDGHGMPDSGFRGTFSKMATTATKRRTALRITQFIWSRISSIAIIHGAQERTRTSTAINHWYLKPARLPIPPPGQAAHR